MDNVVHAFKDQKVGEIAAKIAGATAVFRKYKIDFCCGGNISLSEAASQRGLNVTDIEKALETLNLPPSEAPHESSDLIDYILARFHETHRRELPELTKLARRVEAVHKEHPYVPQGLADLLDNAEMELDDHMAKEEEILFPSMRANAYAHLGMPIHVMRHEHNGHGETIRKLEGLTNNFTLPEDACRSWQALYTGVEKFVHDLMEHIHLENNILFPRFERR